MNQSTTNVLFTLLRSVICGDQLSKEDRALITDDVIQKLLLIARRHDVEHLLVAGLRENGFITDEDELLDYAMTAVYRYEQKKHALDQICEALEHATIPYVLLKGSVIRAYYPEPWMRTSCDIDILVREEDIDSAAKALQAIGYRYDKKNYHDISMFSPTDVHLELHFSILEHMDNIDVVLKDVWDYTVPTDTCQCRMKDEFFVFHMFAHMSYHLLRGGCGIRSLMDVWIMKLKMGLDFQLAKDLLEKAGIYQFATEITHLAEICFSGKEKDEFSDTLLEYILNGGVYGTSQNRFAVIKTDNKSTAVYALKRLFLPYSSMTILYPMLKRFPVLLPFCWIARIFHMLFCGKSKRALSELKTVSEVSEDEIDTVREIRSRLGL